MNKMFLRVICFVLCATAVVGFIFQKGIKREEYLDNKAQLENKALLSVPLICQYPMLPTGCEVTAAVMVLNFLGDNVSKKAFAENWLSKSSDFYTYEGTFYGPDPNEFFVGDPFANYGYGCYAPVIVKAVNSNSKICTAKENHSVELSRLCSLYIDNGQPVLIWATMEMKEPKEGRNWVLPDGSHFTWRSGEHCLVLVGYDSELYYFNDPLSGKTEAFKREIVEQRYRAMGMQSVIIEKK